MMGLAIKNPAKSNSSNIKYKQKAEFRREILLFILNVFILSFYFWIVTYAEDVIDGDVMEF